MRKSCRIVASVLATGLIACAHAAGIQQAFLVQNSGWMEPFYVDSASQLKPLVNAVGQAVTGPEDTTFLMAFSQSAGANVSPRLLAKHTGVADLGPQLNSLGLAYKGAALADTDFREAIVKTVTGPFNSGPGIIWIFTNNKNSPGNDPATAARNLDFYRLLHLEPSVTKTLVFPLRMPVNGKLYRAQGLMVYALAYGEEASRALDDILQAGRLKQVLTRLPARLKPLDADAVRIVPESVKNTPDVRPSLGSDQRTLVLDVSAGKLVPEVVLRASLQNLFYPYVIEHADIHATLSVPGRSVSVAVSPSTVVDLQPDQRQLVEARFLLPIEKVPSPWSPTALAAMGKQVLVPMTVTMELDNQRLAISDDFRSQLKAEFPGDPISDIFTAPSSVRGSRVQVPVVLRIQYPLLPVVVVIVGLIAVVGGLAALAMLSGTSRRYQLVIDDVRRHVVLKPFSSLDVRNGDGVAVGTIKRGLGRPKVSRIEDGHTVRVV